MHDNIIVGCYLEAQVKGGSIPKLDRVNRRSERETCSHPGLNLKVDKMNYSLGSLDPNWKIFLKSRQDISRSG